MAETPSCSRDLRRPGERERIEPGPAELDAPPVREHANARPAPQMRRTDGSPKLKRISQGYELNDLATHDSDKKGVQSLKNTDCR
jgi:hypothetical protein